MDFEKFPDTRYMGSKRKLLVTLQSVFEQLKFDSALDAFSGSSSVSYLLKSMGKKVITNDYLLFNYHIAHAIIENQKITISDEELNEICEINKDANTFIETTFSGLYYSKKECRWLDSTMSNISWLDNEYKKSIALAALCRACIKKRPRGIFTYTGSRYDDGRKDLTTTLEDHFRNAVKMFNECVFNNKKICKANNDDVFTLKNPNTDLVYLDPPYFSLKSDSEYSRRYHFLEGLVSYWSHVEIDQDTKTKKIIRPFSKFNHRNLIIEAFDELFEKHSSSTIVLSYSSNSFPDAPTLTSLLKNSGKSVELLEIDHTYSIGTHSHKMNNATNKVKEYIFLGV